LQFFLLNIRNKIKNHYISIYYDFLDGLNRGLFFLFVPLLLGIGIALYFGMTTEPPFGLGLTCLVISGLTSYYLRNHYIVFLSTLALAIVFIGFTSAQIRTYYLDTQMLKEDHGPSGIEGRIVDIKYAHNAMKIILDRLQISGLSANLVPSRVRLHVPKQLEHFKEGDWVRTFGVIKPVPAPTTPASFDFQRHNYFKQIGAIGFAYGDIKVISENHDQLHSFDYLRKDIQQRILKHFSTQDNDPNIRHLAITFLTGNKQMLDQNLLEDVRASGLAHLLAISGLHIGLVTSLFFISIRTLLSFIPFIALRYPIKKWAAIFAMFGGLFFTLLTDASVPTIRAYIMCLVVLIGILFDRKAISLRTVAWAAIFILLFFPESLLSASFQLSFAAVTALVMIYEKKVIDTAQSKPIRYIKDILKTSIVASLVTMPFSAYHFNKVALWGILSNLIAIPLTVFWIMPLGIIALIMMPFHLEGVFLDLMGWGIQLLIWTARFFATLPLADLTIVQFSTFTLILMTYFIIQTLISQTHRFKVMTFGTVISLCFIYLPSQPDIKIMADGRLSALKTQDGDVMVSQFRNSRFVRENWLDEWAYRHNDAKQYDETLPCDQYGCRFTHPSGKEITFNRNQLAFIEDCSTEAILITDQTVPSTCHKPEIIIDRSSLKQNGAHAVYFSQDGTVKVKTVRENRGQRPWTVY
jgi:competence protein ComEC